MRAIDAIIEEIRKDGEKTRNEIGRMMQLIEQLGDGLSFEEQMQAEIDEPGQDEPEQLNSVFKQVNGETKLVKFDEFKRMVRAYAKRNGDLAYACDYLLDVHKINTTPGRLSTFISAGRKAGYIEGCKINTELMEKFYDEQEAAR